MHLQKGVGGSLLNLKELLCFSSSSLSLNICQTFVQLRISGYLILHDISRDMNLW